MCVKCKPCPHNGVGCFRLTANGHGYCANFNEMLEFLTLSLGGPKNKEENERPTETK